MHCPWGIYKDKNRKCIFVFIFYRMMHDIFHAFFHVVLPVFSDFFIEVYNYQEFQKVCFWSLEIVIGFFCIKMTKSL